MSDNDTAIKVSNVSKSFKLPHEKNNSVKSLFVGLFQGKRTFEKQHVLKGIDFEIKKGEFFGIVGRNGSGKSTLLKLLAGIYTPDEGVIQLSGKLTPFIELGVGFNPELTGRENVFLNGALLGFSRKEMLGMYDEIVGFAELDQFMDQKLKNYSSGMQVRLAFSIAIRANTEILILDEVLAVGDAAFQKKCFDYFDKLKQTGKTVVLVTHDMGSVERFCTKALMIDKGVVKLLASPQEVSRQYTLDNMNTENNKVKQKKEEHENNRLSPEVSDLSISLLSHKNLQSDDVLKFRVSYQLKETINVDIGISIIHNGQAIIEHNTKELKLKNEPGVVHKLDYKYSLGLLNPGIYQVTVAIFEKKKFKLIGFDTDSCNFVVQGPNRGGVLSVRGEWKMLNE